MGNLEENPLILTVERSFPVRLWINFPIIVAVSGGPDSVAMLRALHVLAVNSGCVNRLIVAHVNHQLRSSESDHDADFVRELATQLQLEYHLLSLTPPPGSISEQSLRHGRYGQLLQLAADRGARYLATGHHRDDQAETVLFRICRGTGLAGLRGIPAYRVSGETVTIVRPLLSIRRTEIIAFLRQLGQSWREDRSNDSTEFKRNFLRHKILPQLEDQFGGNVADSLVRLTQQAGEAQDLIHWLVAKLLDHVDFCSTGAVQLDVKPLQQYPPPAQQELMVEIFRRQGWSRGEMSADRWQQLAQYLNDPRPGRFQLPGPIDVVVTPEKLILESTGRREP